MAEDASKLPAIDIGIDSTLWEEDYPIKWNREMILTF